MFQSNDPDAQASTNPSAQPPKSQRQPRRDKIRVLLYGSLEGIDRNIKQLHTLNYADADNWSDPIPTGRPGEWMVITTKHLLIE
ncbi:MAG: hypothetical protein ICV77_13660 [Cyanobacteria bacterium Co-bin8]|nr:hypothetical protein [Cyanobacteria bacterium Co-bin8]